MQSINIILLFSILIQGTLFSKLIFQVRRQKTLGNILICIISVVLLFHLINIYIYQFSDLDIPFHVLPVAIMSYGPLIYTYVRTLSDKGSIPKRTVFYSFIPVLIVAVIHTIGNYDYESWLHISFHAFIYMYSLVYLLASIYLVYVNLTNGKHEWNWTYHYLLLITALTLFIALDYARFMTSWETLQNFTLTGVIWIGFIITAGSLLQNLLYPSPHRINQDSITEKRLRPRLYSTTKENQIAEQLETFMKTSKPYLCHDLTIGKLSEQIHLPGHILSGLINQYFQKNFLEYVNGYRVEAAKQLLTDSNLKILAVALESGFSNKTSFNRTFKKFTGMAPSQFRNGSLG